LHPNHPSLGQSEDSAALNASVVLVPSVLDLMTMMIQLDLGQHSPVLLVIVSLDDDFEQIQQLLEHHLCFHR
jgi:hypothetical protein